jgi:Tol biopolymer transport system component
MFRKITFALFLNLILLLSGCTVDMSQQTSPTPPLPATAGLTGAAPALSPSSPAAVPVTWSGLNLSGKLVYLSGFQQDNNPYMQLQSLDLASGVLTTLYQTPPIGWIYAASVSPDRKQIVLSYASPTNYPSLYLMPGDGSSAPVQLFAPPTSSDQYTQPVWSPDGKYIYFVHANYSLPPEEPNQHYPIFEIERLAYPGGAPEVLLTKAYWPRLSADGSQLVYVSENPDDGTNRLLVSAADGSSPQQVTLTGSVVPTIIDAPLFLPDGQTILFSAPVPAQSFVPGWLDWLLGVRTASAHSIPSEWWSVPASGGAATQLTHIQSPGLYASLSPDGTQLASFSGNGVFVMAPDGSGLTMIVSDVGGIPGTVNWIP